MKALFAAAPGITEVKEVPLPAVKASGVRVKVLRARIHTLAEDFLNGRYFICSCSNLPHYHSLPAFLYGRQVLATSCPISTHSRTQLHWSGGCDRRGGGTIVTPQLVPIEILLFYSILLDSYTVRTTWLIA